MDTDKKRISRKAIKGVRRFKIAAMGKIKSNKPPHLTPTPLRGLS